MKKLLLNTWVVIAFVLISNITVSAQGTYNICSVAQTTDSFGTLYDTGGPNQIYQVNEDCTLLVAPPCAVSITLTFQGFSTESGFDFFTVYDGQTTAAPQLMHTAGTTIPTPVTCNSGFMLIVWHSDVSITDSGFACSWTSVIGSSAAPVTNFTVSTLTPPFHSPVQFTDQSIGDITGWIWNFGGGPTDSSHRQNPVHVFQTSGTFIVQLISFSCTSSDTSYQTVTVQAPPHIVVTPDSMVANAQCGQNVSFQLGITNTGGGELVYNLTGASNQAVRVVAMTYGADLFSEFPHTLQAIDQFFTNYTLTQTATTDPSTLQGMLVGKNVLLIPEQETGQPATWALLGPVIRGFLNNGGSVIWLGSYSSEADCMFGTNVWTGTFFHDLVFNTLDIIDGSHPLMAGITGSSFTAPSASWGMDLTNSDKVVLVRDRTSGKDAVAYRFHGPGKAIFIAFDYYNLSPGPGFQNEHIIANAIEWGGQNSLASWINLSQDSGTVTAPNTSNVTVTFQTTGLPAGTYYSNIAVSSNDTSNAVVVVPCTLTVSGNPIIALSDTCKDFGNVMQHTTSTQTFDVINDGCDTLFINNITSNAPEFTISANVPYLLPGASHSFNVLFSSATVGTFTGQISVLNNAHDTTICLTATTFAAPIATVNPASGVAITVPACDHTDSLSFYIGNGGGSDLTYIIPGTPSWLSASPTSGTIVAGDSTQVTLIFNSGQLVGQAYPTTILITSNDPLAPSKSLPCTLNVGLNPCISFTYTSDPCTGISVFTSTSINTPSSYHWDFGDGDTSSLANPSHAYDVNGTDTVVLIASNSDGADTATEVINVVVTGPRVENCYPATLSYCCLIGITNVTLEGINKTTNDAIDGYKDYTCTDTTTIATNAWYTMRVTTGFTYVETVKAWIDWNDDGVLDSTTEEVFADSAVLTNHIDSFWVPSTAVLHRPLRLRVASDYSNNPTPTPCLDLTYGQVEDYTVFVDFYDQVNELSDAVQFGVYPNPYNRSTQIEYSLKSHAKVTAEVYNALGDKVDIYCTDEMQSPGKHLYKFEGSAPGVYFVKLIVDGKPAIQKIIKM